jgi:hypothetical protein
LTLSPIYAGVITVEILYRINPEVKKIFDGGEFQSIKFDGELIFVDLTKGDKEKLDLDVKGKTATVAVKGNVPPNTDATIIKRSIINRLEKAKRQYEKKMIIVEPEELLLPTDAFFKEKEND